MCSGYYRYDEGYSPEFPGIDRFGGQVIHPQHWPEDLDYAGKRVVVIGSGATAVTLVPAMAETAGHVTMLQRSPTYVVSIPGEDPIANFVRRLLPEKAAYAVVRWKNVLLQMAVYRLSKRRPKLVRNLIRKGTIKALPEGYEVDKHFKPKYDPWDQRMCAIPDGDLFEAISDGSAEIVTDRIETFTESGVKLESGQELEADIVITATGLNLLFLGGMDDLRRRRGARRLADDDLQGHAAQRRPQLRLHPRLLERLLDPESRPDQRVRLPPAQPHGRARLLRLRAPRPRRPAQRRARWSNSPPATSSARSRNCRSRAPATPGS